MHTQERTIEQVKHVRMCQSPLACGNRAVKWNARERMYLCKHCQEVLNELQTGISVAHTNR